MKQLTKIPMTKLFIGSAALLMTVAIGCNNAPQDKVESNPTADSANMTTPVTTGDTTLTATPPTNDTVGTMGNGNMAKPNPAKKGGKGKISVTEQKRNTNAAMTMDNTGIYSNAEVMPAYPGGYNTMSNFFADNVEYPQDATDNGIEGTVEVNFAVDETGKLSNAKVISPRIGYGLEEEALRIVNRMPTWTPGRIKGKNVKTYYTLPVRFQLY